MDEETTLTTQRSTPKATGNPVDRLRTVLNEITTKTNERLKADRVSIFLLDREKRKDCSRSLAWAIGFSRVALNCAALPDNLVEAELFGIEKTVATGVDQRIGKFEAANGRTLFWTRSAI